MRVGSIDEVADYLVNGYLEDNPGTRLPSVGRNITVNFENLTSSENINLVDRALDAWSELGFNFTKSSSNFSDIVLADDPDLASGGAVTFEISQFNNSGVYVPTEFLGTYGSALGGYTYQTWLHEIGHALGLDHAGNYNGTATYGVDNRFTNDSWQISVMSYFAQDDNPTIDADFAYVLTPMPADIAAIEQLYGFDAMPGAGASVYFWGSNLDGIYGEISRQVVNGSLGSPSTPFTITIVDKSGVDTLNFAGSSDAVAIDLTPGSINSAFGINGNVLIERNTVIERVIGSHEGDIIRGQGGNNILDGRDGHDSIVGEAGNDALYGGQGNDTLVGSSGRDLLRGGLGADVIVGGDDLDTLLLGDGGVRLDLVNNALSTGEARGDTITGVERVAGGQGADAILGNAENNIFQGRVGDDRLIGRGGSDILHGDQGDDFLFSGSGNDIINAGSGADTIRGGAGTDRLVYISRVDLTVDLIDQSSNRGIALGDDINGIENVSGSRGEDKLYGDNSGNLLIGNAGEDTLYGRNGNDQLYGRADDDTLIGGGGNDSIYGGNGDDELVTDSGRDVVSGGAGEDEFVFRGGEMIITDFVSNIDELELDIQALGFGPGASVSDILAVARVADGDTVFDFGSDLVVLEGVTRLLNPAEDIDFYSSFA